MIFRERKSHQNSFAYNFPVIFFPITPSEPTLGVTQETLCGWPSRALLLGSVHLPAACPLSSAQPLFPVTQPPAAVLSAGQPRPFVFCVHMFRVDLVVSARCCHLSSCNVAVSEQITPRKLRVLLVGMTVACEVSSLLSWCPSPSLPAPWHCT